MDWIECIKKRIRHKDGAIVTLGSRGYFFLIDTDRSRRSRVNEARNAERKK